MRACDALLLSDRFEISSSAGAEAEAAVAAVVAGWMVVRSFVRLSGCQVRACESRGQSFGRSVGRSSRTSCLGKLRGVGGSK